MAKIRVRFGKNEIEIDSRDFYVDNETVGEVIENIRQCMGESENQNPITSLPDAEIFEPEFSQGQGITSDLLTEKLNILAGESFFDQPRTVGEVVGSLMEHGWHASALDVSVALTKMAFSKELLKNSHDDRSYYFAKTAMVNQ
jgi:hypothetical protein